MRAGKAGRQTERPHLVERVCGYVPMADEVCGEKTRELVESGRMRIRDLLDAVDVRRLTPAEVRAIVPLGGAFANANTPEELAKLEELSRR